MSHTDSDREVDGSPFEQSAEESVAWPVDCSPWGVTPDGVTSVTARVWNPVTEAWDAIAGTVLTGTAAINGQEITLPYLHSLQAGNQYRLDVLFTESGNSLEFFVRFDAKD